MIGYLEGTLKQLDATRALVVAGGVGYEVHISLQTYYKLEGQRDVALEIYTHVREDALSLYGFAIGEEKFAFEKLISISGIGPTLAQKILSGIDAARSRRRRGARRRAQAVVDPGRRQEDGGPHLPRAARQAAHPGVGARAAGAVDAHLGRR